jgi:integral membrane protein
VTTTPLAERRTGLTPRRFYRVIAIAEAITWTLLIAGMLLKYVITPGEIGDLAVRVSGSIHGFVFITYAATAVIVGLNQRWPLSRIGFGVLTAVIPYATIPFERWLERRGLLEGDWRTQATDDARDRTWVDRLLRWFLSRPMLLVVVFVVAVVALFAIALTVGPPGGDH